MRPAILRASLSGDQTEYREGGKEEEEGRRENARDLGRGGGEEEGKEEHMWKYVWKVWVRIGRRTERGRKEEGRECVRM